MVTNQFQNHLLNLPKGVEVHITLGDLFDAGYIPSATLLDAIITYQTAAMDNPGTKFFILQGNHDINKELNKKSAFHVLAHVLEPLLNVKVITKETYLPELDTIFLPWQPKTSATEAISSLPPAKNAITHFDMEGTPNSMPQEEFKARGVETVFNGHIHRPEAVNKDGITYHLIGSMQPYAFDQDPDGRLYVKISLQEFKENPEKYKDKVIKIELQEGEEFSSHDFDCLALSVVRSENRKNTTDINPEAVNFDIYELLKLGMEKRDVDLTVMEEVLNLWSRRSSSM